MSGKTVKVAIADIVQRKELMPRKGVSDVVVKNSSLSVSISSMYRREQLEAGKERRCFLELFCHGLRSAV